MNMDEIPKNLYSDPNPFASDPTATFTIITAAIVNSITVASSYGSVRDMVPSKTVDESLEIQGKHSEAMVELFKICAIHQIFPPEEFSLSLQPKIEMVARRLEKQLKLDQRKFLMNSFPPVYGDETRRNVAVALGLQRTEDNDRYMKNCRNGRSPKETRWWFHDDKNMSPIKINERRTGNQPAPPPIQDSSSDTPNLQSVLAALNPKYDNSTCLYTLVKMMYAYSSLNKEFQFTQYYESCFMNIETPDSGDAARDLCTHVMLYTHAKIPCSLRPLELYRKGVKERIQLSISFQHELVRKSQQSSLAVRRISSYGLVFPSFHLIALFEVS
ncbi:hypothetical protein FXO37_08565 [Capsicum annuum]|nr:hypothetical protein FXO37_08565 [Capsicum annuum]